MQIFEITNRKIFMGKLLKSNLFDTFEVREVILHGAFKSVFDGKRNKDFLDYDESVHSDFVTWQEMQPYIYQFMTGTKLPSYFKIVLATSKEKTTALSTDASAFFLNITFKDNVLSCSTGVAYNTFTLDKTPEKLWDERIQSFLFKYEFL